MTTDQANEKLAEIYRTGDSDTTAERAADGHLWRAVEAAEEHDWNQASYSLEAAYHALGADPSAAAADDLEQGVHPIQVEAERQHREVVSEEWAET
jgi:hypothetical protein